MVENVFRELQQPIFTIRESLVPHRNVTHWDHQGLLIGETLEGRWRRLNFVEIFWLRIVAHLRSFEIPLAMIKKVKESICTESIYLWSVYKGIGSTEEGLLEKYPTRISSLTSLLIHTILFRWQYIIIVPKEGEVKTLNINTIDPSSNFFYRNDLVTKTFLCVSMTEVLLDSFRKIALETLTQLSILTPAEAELVGLLRRDQLKSVTIRLDSGRELDLFVLAMDTDTVSTLLNLIWQQGYQRITWESKDGRVTYFEWPDRFKSKPGLPDGSSTE
ncbi:MAG: hypothetical protein WC865_05515 [Bacteroidales bacterium]